MNELTPFIENLITQFPTVGVLLYIVVITTRRLDEIVSNCNQHLEELNEKLIDKLDGEGGD